MVPGIYRKDRIRQCIWCHVLLFQSKLSMFLTRNGGSLVVMVDREEVYLIQLGVIHFVNYL